MTIDCWIICVLISVVFVVIEVSILSRLTNKIWKSLSVVITIVLIIFVFIAGFWYCNNTASGIRSMTDQKAELSNGLNRVVNVYTANGDLIATYCGKIDLEDNDGGYILFDYEGKRHTYYNCFVESIAEID